MIKKIIVTPLQRFVKTESLAGMLLFGTAIIALLWANSSYSEFYEKLWALKIGVSFEDFELKKPLILWINDGLMAIFFFVIGLELKRELLIGEINTVKKATFPFIAALGGILVPVVLYLILNKNQETANGWGIPMATDIAFALAILSTLGKRVPLSLKIFLTAFAIIDDIAAVLVIAIFYSTDINWMYILYGLIIVTFLGIIYYKRKYSFAIGIILAAIVWFLFLKSGVHPTIAGVLLAFTIPIKRKLKVGTFSEKLYSISDDIKKSTEISENKLLSKNEMKHVDNLEELSAEVRSPLQNLEHKLHRIVAYFILPVFALANSGVTISTDYDFDFALLISISVSLFVGKFIGVALFSFIGVKLKITELPSGVHFTQILGIAAIAGVGFTMSIFIDNLAFTGDLISINSGKVGIIIGSITSGIVGYSILRLMTNTNKNNT